MKPTVSESMTLWPPPSSHFLVRVMSVAKSWSLAKAPPSVRALKSVLLPALV